MKTRIKNLIFTLFYLLLGAGSFVAAGMFLNQAFIDSNRDDVVRALLFCGLGLFWLFMFGEKRRHSAFQVDEEISEEEAEDIDEALFRMQNSIDDEPE